MLCLLESNLGLQLVAAVEALCLLQNREQGAVDPKALAFSEHLQSAMCFQKPWTGCVHRYQKKLVQQLKKFEQHSYGTMKVHKRGRCA